MRVIKPLQQGLLYRTMVKNKRYYLCVASLNYFPFHNPIALGTEMEMWETISNCCDPDAVFDSGIPKVQSEVFMVGNCYAPTGRPAKRLFVDLDIGPIVKRVVVTGDRHWKRGERHDGILSRVVGSDWEASDPEPFTEMDIGWRNAFGGAGYPENPLGKGFLPADMSPNLDHTSPLPNIERPEWMVSIPNAVAEPAGYGPIDVTWPQRAGKHGKKYNKKWEKERFPEPAVDMDPTYYNSAPDDQQLRRGFWQGDERFVITHMHPEKKELESGLPQVRPRCFIQQSGGGRSRWSEIDLYPETVWLFPNVERGVLINRGLIEVETFYGVDVDVLLMAWELKSGKTRSAEDYQNSAALRINEETSDDWVFRQDDLSPPEGIPEEEPVFVDERDCPTDYGPLIEKENAELTSILDKAKETAEKLGLDPASYISNLSVPKIELPAPPKLQTMSDIPKLIEWSNQQEAKLDAQTDSLTKKAKFAGKTKEEVKAKIETKAKEICKMAGQDYDEFVSHSKRNPTTPKAAMDKLTNSLIEAKTDLADRPAELAKLDDMLQKTEALKSDFEKVMDSPELKEAQLATAHNADPPEIPSDDILIAKREWVVNQYAAGKGSGEADLSFADLSGLSLAGMDFKGANLDSVSFQQSDLTGADFSGAILARADFSHAVLIDARFNGANLGRSVFVSSKLTDAKLDDVVLEYSDFTGADLTKAIISGEMCLETKWVKSNLSEARLRDLEFLESDFNEATLIGADLSGASFVTCSLVGADFSKANLNETVFTEVNAVNATFRSAQMKDTSIHMESDFSGANFSQIDSDGLNFSQTKLMEATFSFANLTGADFGESTLVRANLERILGRESSFTDADLSHAFLMGADLMGASLQGAILIGADFTDAHLFGADLMFAKTADAVFSGAVIKRTLLEEK